MPTRSSILVALVIASPACTATRTQPELQPGPRMAMSGPMMSTAGAVGCMGRDSATMAQMRVVHELTVNHTRITRTVTNLPDGIHTVTESDDPRLAELIREHVFVMADRVRMGDDPALPMESPALRSIFRDRDKIRNAIEPTAKGVLLVQTSRDPGVVAALQQHAVEVSDLTARGMVAMREARMKHGGEMMGPGCEEMRALPASPAHRP